MKMFRKTLSNIGAVLTTLLIASACLFSEADISRVKADDVQEETTITYIETEVERIAFAQHPSCVYMGFQLTVSDYDDFGYKEGETGGIADYFDNQLTYRKDFAQLNSEGVIFDQSYVYWNSGWNVAANATALMPSMFENTVAHRTSLQRLEYGFVVMIPAGTTFPSLTYVQSGCVGDIVMYKTLEDKAFYYDNESFVALDYNVASSKIEALNVLNSVDVDAYYDAEREEVESLVQTAKEDIKLSASVFAVQERMSKFSLDIEKLMTIADYQQLAERKEETKVSTNALFEALSESDYDEEDWQTIQTMWASTDNLVDGCKTFEEVEAAIQSIRFALSNVLTKAEKSEFAEYRNAALTRIENAFVETLYRETERAQGVALVEEGKQAVESAKNYNEVDGFTTLYIAQILALKTDAQWSEEEEANKQDENSSNHQSEECDSAETDSDDEADGFEKSGCVGAVNEISIIFGVAVMVAAVTIKNKAGKKDEE